MWAAVDSRTRFRLSAAATSIYWTALAVTTHAPLKPEDFEAGFELPPWSDKVYHLAAFCLLAALLTATCDIYAHWKQSGSSPRRRLLLIVAVLSAYAAVDELTQPLTHRFCDFWDWAADTVGATAGTVMYRFFVRR